LELHAGLALFQEDLASMFLFAHQSYPLLSEHSYMYSTNPLYRGYEHLLAGDLDAACQGFLEGYRVSESSSLRPRAFAASLLLGEACFAKGDLLKASGYFRQDLADADENPEIFRQRSIGSRETFFALWAYHNLAMLAYEWNELAAAQHYLAQALGEDPEEEIHVLTSGRLIWARLLHRCRETVRAEHLLRTWERQARWLWVLRSIRAAQARLHLALGNLPAVEHWSRTKDHFFGFPIRERDMALPYVFQEEEALLQVRLLLAQEKAEEASNPQIATQLVISLVTVKKHVTNLLGKLGAANRTQAVVRARHYGLL
jgi:LuxR family maltose regulon positive regulatory protein